MVVQKFLNSSCCNFKEISCKVIALISVKLQCCNFKEINYSTTNFFKISIRTVQKMLMQGKYTLLRVRIINN